MKAYILMCCYLQRETSDILFFVSVHLFKKVRWSGDTPVISNFNAPTSCVAMRLVHHGIYELGEPTSSKERTAL